VTRVARGGHVNRVNHDFVALSVFNRGIQVGIHRPKAADFPVRRATLRDLAQMALDRLQWETDLDHQTAPASP
jgi:hypothetical protein